MSQEDVDLAKRFFGLLNARDVEGLVELLAPNFVRYMGPEQPDGDVVKGREGYTAYARSWLEAFEEYEIEVLEYIDRDDWVIAVGRIRASGRSSRVVVDQGDAWIYRFKNGLITESRECGTREDALEAAGLPE